MHIIQEHIYTVDHEGDLIPRHGSPLELDLVDTAELFEIPPHIMRVGGLMPTDFAVFFHLEAARQEAQSYGYLVTAVEEDGEGILVLGDAMEADPQTWMSERLANMMLLAGEEQVAEFNLVGLYKAVQARKQAA